MRNETKIQDLQADCNHCMLGAYCTQDPDSTPMLCKEELDINMTYYKKAADALTPEEIDGKIKEYEANNISPWDDTKSGAICDLVLEKQFAGTVI